MARDYSWARARETGTLERDPQPSIDREHDISQASLARSIPPREVELMLDRITIAKRD